MALQSIHPATGELIRSYPEMSGSEVGGLLEEAGKAFALWREWGLDLRGQCLKRVSELLKEKKEELSRLITLEMGKPIAQSRAEIEKCAWVADFYAENAKRFLKPEIVSTEAAKSFVSFEPLGVVLAIMPWNFPFWQVFRFAVPALMAGNAAVLKHASNVTGCALAIEDLFRRSGAPENLFRVLLLSSAHLAPVIGHPLVRAVTLTGSTAAGQAVAAQAGRALKKTVMELGGSDPFVVLGDADLAKAVETAAASKLVNGGQSCIAAKRFIVVEALRNDFEERLVERMKKIKMGDPFENQTELGPLAREDLRQDLDEQVRKSIKKGARLLLGGKIPSGKGAFYPPTVLTDVREGMPAYTEELFGPVAAIIPVKDEEEAVAVANDSPFGLGASLFTGDLKKGEFLAAERIEAGLCFVNGMVRSDPRLPFGGVKGSGYGRELSAFGIREFVNIKTVWVNR